MSLCDGIAWWDPWLWSGHCVYVCVECGTMVGVGQALGLIVCGLVGPGTSHCAHNGTE